MRQQFDSSGIVVTPPTPTFDRELVARSGPPEVRLINVGPTHTEEENAYVEWSDRERIVANVFALYREFNGRGAHGTVPELFSAMDR